MQRSRVALMRRALVALLAALVVGAWSASAAWAAPPLALDQGLVTDDAQILGSERAEVEDALELLNDEQGVQLFVVYVESFDGMDSQEWANETASINGLGLNDMLLAVAVTDRQYAWSVDDGFPLSDAELDSVAADSIEPQLQESDWAGAAIAAAEGYGEALAASAPSDSDADSSGGTSPWSCALPALFIAAIGAAVAFVLMRRKGRGAAGAASAPSEPSTKDLETAAGKALLDVDEALRSSEQEIGFAEAEFGAAAIQEYRTALDESKRDVAEAFKIQQQVYDAEPEDDTTRRTMLKRISELAAAADARLDEKADAFSRLRDLAGRADEVLASVTTRLDKVEAGLPGARESLNQLKSAYLPSALGEIADDDEQAAALLETGRKAAAEASSALAGGDRNAAALAARTAEDATVTAEQLLASVAAAGGQLQTASTALAEETPRLEATASAAQTQDSARYSALVATARTTAAAARAALQSPPLDPVVHLASVRAAATALDAALAQARDEAQRLEAARTSAVAVMTTTRDRIASAESFIATRGSAIGTQARSSLAEGKARLERAEQQLNADPAQALTDAQSAQQYAESALRYAQGDVSVPSPSPSSAGSASTRMPSGFGGSSRNHSSSRASASSSSSSSRRSGSSTSSSSRRSGGGRF